MAVAAVELAPGVVIGGPGPLPVIAGPCVIESPELAFETARRLASVARRVVRPQWPYVLRQGVANLHRPANQTRAVVVALGCGAFLISTLYLVQSALLREFSTTTQASRGNLLFFDVQQDQARGKHRIGGNHLANLADLHILLGERMQQPGGDYREGRQLV